MKERNYLPPTFEEVFLGEIIVCECIVAVQRLRVLPSFFSSSVTFRHILTCLASKGRMLFCQLCMKLSRDSFLLLLLPMGMCVAYALFHIVLGQNFF